MRPLPDITSFLGRKTLNAVFAAAALAVTINLVPVPAAQAAETTVFAAASLKTALDDIVVAYQAGGSDKVIVSYGGSSALAKQIEQGAPADIFISASTDWMDKLAKAKLIKEDSRVDLLGNTLVLVAHGADAPKVEITGKLDLAALLGDNRLAMALVDSVPAGVYGKAALTSLGLWPSVEAKVAQSDNVRAALALVAAGEAPFGIVYATDAVAEKNVSVVGTFPPSSHDPIVYPAALTAEAKDGAAAFLAYLQGQAARSAFERQGFKVLGK
ncbi:molybdate ABC transporter substrate-binding protein [Pannonibacter sp. SL95]|uniref:molybdate ABC transporter substrate-binding protein n=1 Tax=Pannonibacter sp. SL95 TaxID=2995153 RepID=UPI0022730F2E|nr:molybdate ABC transporter substrate-binding protein [Pannonibacter sp. SL95]MCY1704680.1 molybdate ABC transporter substrate-binding protein [Pannonibacter sp. SL95]